MASWRSRSVRTAAYLLPWTVDGAAVGARSAADVVAEQRIRFTAAQETVAVGVIAIECRYTRDRRGFCSRQETVPVRIEPLECRRSSHRVTRIVRLRPAHQRIGFAAAQATVSVRVVGFERDDPLSA